MAELQHGSTRLEFSGCGVWDFLVAMYIVLLVWWIINYKVVQKKIAQKIAQSLLRHHFATVCSTDSCGYHQNAQ